MDSKHHIDNFQAVLVAKSAIFSMKKTQENFPFFEKLISMEKKALENFPFFEKLVSIGYYLYQRTPQS